MGTDDGRPLLRRDLRRRRSTGLASLFAAPAASGVPDADADPTPTILVVCTGNICRSPLGELLLRERLAPLGVQVHSAGTGAPVGHRMSHESQRVARELGIDAADAAAHRARALTDEMVARADVILTMTVTHRTNVVGRVPAALRRVFTVREFAALAGALGDDLPAQDAAASPRTRLATAVARVAAERGSIPTGTDLDDVMDPFGRSPEAYDESARQLVPAIDEVVRVVEAALAPGNDDKENV